MVVRAMRSIPSFLMDHIIGIAAAAQSPHAGRDHEFSIV
jgi:hypothetical protein